MDGPKLWLEGDGVGLFMSWIALSRFAGVREEIRGKYGWMHVSDGARTGDWAVVPRGWGCKRRTGMHTVGG